MTKKKVAIYFAVVLFVVFAIGCSREDSKRQISFRQFTPQSSKADAKKSQSDYTDAITERLAKIEQWLEKEDYKLFKMTIDRPFLTSKPYSQELDEMTDFWSCYKSTSLTKIFLTTSVAEDGKFLEIQFPLVVKDDALKLAKYLDSDLFNASTKLIAQSEESGELKLPSGYSVSLLTNCPTATDKRAIVIRSVKGPHEFNPANHQNMLELILLVYKEQHNGDQK